MSDDQIDLALKALSAFSVVLSCFSGYVSFFQELAVMKGDAGDEMVRQTMK